MMAGASPAAVQRILGHSDPRLTAETYGHLAPDYLRGEVERLAFTLPPADVPVVVEVPSRAVAGADQTPLSAQARPNGSPEKEKAGTPPDSGAIPASWMAGCTGLEPVASGVTGRRYNRLN